MWGEITCHPKLPSRCPNNISKTNQYMISTNWGVVYSEKHKPKAVAVHDWECG